MPNNLRLIDPRQQAIDKTTSNLYIPAMKELEWEPPLYVLLYNQIRYYEDYGKLKCAYSVASKEVLAEQFGVTVQQIEQAYNTLTNIKHLGNWQICDKRIFRNVKKVWVSNVRQARGTMEEMAEMLENSDKIRAKLLQNQSKTLTESELASLGDPCPKVIESNINIGSAYASPADAGSAQATQSSSADADSDLFIKDNSEFPFDEDVDVVSVKPTVNKNKSAKAGVIYSKVCDSLGIKKLKSDCAVARIRSLLDNGMTEKEIMDTVEWTKTDEFYSGGGVMSRLANDAIQKAQLSNKKQRRNNDSVESEVIF